MKYITILALFCLILLPGMSPAEDFFDTQLNRGIRNSDVYSSLLMQEAGSDRRDALSLLSQAKRYSPDLPSVYFTMAKEKFSFSSSGVLASVDYLIAGFDAYARNFWWSFSLAGSVFYSLILSFILVMLIIAVIRSITDLPLVSHEIVESKRNFFPFIALLLLSLISPLLFLAATLVILGVYMSRTDRFVVYLFLAALLCSPFLFKTASRFLQIASSGEMKAVVAVNESRDNGYALTSLKSSKDPAALFSYALALKREGLYHEALEGYRRLVGMRSDIRAAAYVNMGNAYVGLADMERALESYQLAVQARSLASAYYNLSAVSRELLDYDKGNIYFRKALEIDREAVSRYYAVAARTPNRIVADETISFPDLWNLAEKTGGSASTFNLVVLSAWANTVAAGVLIIALYYLSTASKVRAYRCRRCNSIFCPRCEKHLMWGQMCSRCFHSLVKLDEIEVRERVSRLISIYEHQKRRRGLMRMLSFLLPGASQIFGGRVLYGFLFMWPFLFLLLLPITNSYLSSGPLVSHGLLNSFSLLFAAFIYVLSNIITRQRITKGWL